MGPVRFWLPTFLKSLILGSVEKKKIIQAWNHLNVSKWWNFHLWTNYPFRSIDSMMHTCWTNFGIKSWFKKIKSSLKVTAVHSRCPCYQYVCVFQESITISCYLHILSCPCSTLPFSLLCLCFLVCYTHFSFPHTWYWQPSSGTQCIQRMFHAFFPLLNSSSSLLFAASVICSYSHVSRSLFGHFLFRQELTSAKSVQIWQHLDNKSTPSWQLENTVHNLRRNVWDSHEHSTAQQSI